MTAVFAHPLRIVALLVGFGLVMLAGSLREQQASTRAVGTTGWVSDVVVAVGRDSDPRLLRGRDPLTDEALAKQLAESFTEAGAELVTETRGDRLSDDMILVRYSAMQYLRLSGDVYRHAHVAASNHRLGSEPLDRTDPGLQRKVRERAQWRTNLHEALLRAGLDGQARSVTAVEGFTAKLPAADDPIVLLGGVAAPST